MSDDIILPTADAIIAPVLEKLYELRPNSFQHLNLRTGVYWHPVLGFRAQAALMLKRLSNLVAERRLNAAEGQALLDYVASEFMAVPETDKTFATGTITLNRPEVSPLPGGDIPKGTKFTRSETMWQGVKFPAAEYETLTDAHIDVNSSASVTIPIRAARAGADANCPILRTVSAPWSVSFPSIVANTAVSAFEAAGGSEGPGDAFLRMFARAYSIGQYGPTIAASRLGALSSTGVRHFLVYDTPSTGTQTLAVADESWASSTAWARSVQQSMYDTEVVGFGCKVSVVPIENIVITAQATVSLRDPNYLKNTTEIDQAINKTVRSFFDDRPEFHIWDSTAVAAAVARAHPKIFTCPSVTIKDAASGSTIPGNPTERYHFLLASNSVKVTYTGPV